MELSMTIDGRGVWSDKQFDVINPSDCSVVSRCPECSKEQLDGAMEAAQRAFLTWRGDRQAWVDALVACAEVIEAHIDELATILTKEQGKPLKQATGEVRGTANNFRGAAEMHIESQTTQDDDAKFVQIRRVPIGVVGAICPWNVPILLAAWKAVPALAVGNTVVLKPSPFTPLATLRLGEIIRDVLPPGVLNIVSGGDELGAMLASHPAVRRVSFTGSVATGKKIAAAAAPDLKRIGLELGGNDAAIVLADADPATVAPRIANVAFGNSGQVCVAIKRLYVHESVFDALVAELKTAAESKKVGDGFDPTSELGPINNERQFRRVVELVEDAKRSGATIVTGGVPYDRAGFFYPPTVVTGVAEGTRLVDEEQFGPVLPVMPYSTEEEAVERANATTYGLGGSVWTADEAHGIELASQLECGVAWVNGRDFGPNATFGGMKWSGIGRELGQIGLEELTEVQSLIVTRGAS